MKVLTLLFVLSLLGCRSLGIGIAKEVLTGDVRRDVEDVRRESRRSNRILEDEVQDIRNHIRRKENLPPPRRREDEREIIYRALSPGPLTAPPTREASKAMSTGKVPVPPHSGHDGENKLIGLGF